MHNYKQQAASTAFMQIPDGNPNMGNKPGARAFKIRTFIRIMVIFVLGKAGLAANLLVAAAMPQFMRQASG